MRPIDSEMNTLKALKSYYIISRGRKIVLVSATPLNNKFGDILSQIKLFNLRENRDSGIPNLDNFFDNLERPLRQLDRSDEEYAVAVRRGFKTNKDKVLKHIMVRRTRTEIKNYFGKDLKKQGLFFPEVADPNKFIYKFDSELEKIFSNTLEMLQVFSYSRYTPKRFIKKDKRKQYKIEEFELQQQRNLGGFMKGILIKRLESSFAFKQTVKRFIASYEDFIEMFENGTVLISKKLNVYDLLDRDDIDEIIAEHKDDVQSYKSSDFEPNFINLLNEDLRLLKEIESLWKNVNKDPNLKPSSKA